MATQLGIIIDNAYLSTFEAQMAAATAGTAHPRSKLHVRRCYMSTNNPTSGNTAWTSNSPGGNIMPFFSAGYGAWVSFNVASPPQGWIDLLPGHVGNAAFLTKLNAIIAFCYNANAQHPLGINQINYASLHHEPERDVTPVADNVAGDAYRAAQEYVYGLWRANAPSNWKFCAVLQYNTLETPSGAPASSASTCIFPNRASNVIRDARRWFTPACDIIGIDGPYNYRGSSNGDGSGWLSDPSAAPLGQGSALYATPGTRWYNPKTGRPAGDPDKLRHWQSFSAGLGGPTSLAIGEFTSYILNPANAYPPSQYATSGIVSTPQGLSSSRAVAERADWISAWAEYWAPKPDLKLVCWYERDSVGSSFANGRISGDPPQAALPHEPVSLRNYSAIGDGVAVGTTIIDFSPTTGIPGDVVTILGSGFTGTTAVRFGGITTTFAVINPGRIDAFVPNLVVDAPITVVSPTGTATSVTSFIVGAYSIFRSGVVSPMTRVKSVG